jgi:hypothetical protein
MYLSPVVRTLRDDPVPGEDVTLQLAVADEADTESVTATIETRVTDLGGAVVDHLEFETVVVRVPQDALPAVCGLDGIDSVETAATLGITPGDAGEDLATRDETDRD